MAEQPRAQDASVPGVTEDEGARPVRLLVPDLDLDVPLDAVGVDGGGLMEIPEDADRAGWYRFGPRPGADAGSAVVAGHVDDLGGPGAFLRLTEVAEGMPVVVEHEDGSRTSYTVTGRRTTEKKKLAVDDLFERDGPPLLRLVTCTGPWSDRAGSYRDNLVVTASPVG
ncbi:putative secreted protein [Serinicoccus hydrothermalis]|uniref:Putative secreted protein n=1 Tax=Serinicoccus hydrothermalis TaxID=1758689 RepID=A0A1B1NCI4_9MICO|nr:putative secreted protein [Serinicoccus hydrothermalis]